MLFSIFNSSNKEYDKLSFEKELKFLVRFTRET